MKKTYIQPTAKNIICNIPLMLDASKATPANPLYEGGGDAKASFEFFDDEDED